MAWQFKTEIGCEIISGWKAFVNEHSLRIGDQILFMYLRYLAFQVTILNAAGCQVTYATDVGSEKLIRLKSLTKCMDAISNEESSDNDSNDGEVEKPMDPYQFSVERVVLSVKTEGVTGKGVCIDDASSQGTRKRKIICPPGQRMESEFCLYVKEVYQAQFYRYLGHITKAFTLQKHDLVEIPYTGRRCRNVLIVSAPKAKI